MEALARVSLEATMQLSWTRAVVTLLPLWLVFTGEHQVRADSARPATPPILADETPHIRPVEPPSHHSSVSFGPSYALHNTWGPTVRLASVVGTVSTELRSATALGLSIAAGHRFGRLALESELSGMRLLEPGPSSQAVGSHTHLGVIARYDVVRIGSRLAGPNTMVAMFVEGGAANTWNRWNEHATDLRTGVRPRDTERVTGQAGFGVAIDHRVLQPAGFPNRIAWHLGWRFSAPTPKEQEYACRGQCLIASTPMQVTSGTTPAATLETTVVFQSSLAFSW